MNYKGVIKYDTALNRCKKIFDPVYHELLDNLKIELVEKILYYITTYTPIRTHEMAEYFLFGLAKTTPELEKELRKLKLKRLINNI